MLICRKSNTIFFNCCLLTGRMYLRACCACDVVVVAVSCPVCSVHVPERSINVHLDRCLRNDSSEHCVSVRSVTSLSCLLVLCHINIVNMLIQ